MKLPGVISLRKLLPVCAIPNGGFFRARGHDIEEVDENALRGLRPEVVETLVGLDGAEERLEHHVELAGRRKSTLRAAVRAVDVGQAVVGQVAVLGLVGLLEVIGPEAVVAVEALGQRVVKRLDMARRPPDLGGEDHRGIKSDDIVATGHHGPPPRSPDVLLQLDAQRAVVPGRPGPAVDLAGRVDETATFREIHDGVVAVGRHLARVPGRRTRSRPYR